MATITDEREIKMIEELTTDSEIVIEEDDLRKDLKREARHHKANVV